jgi:hypothetical protein
MRQFLLIGSTLVFLFLVSPLQAQVLDDFNDGSISDWTVGETLIGGTTGEMTLETSGPANVHSAPWAVAAGKRGGQGGNDVQIWMRKTINTSAQSNFTLYISMKQVNFGAFEATDYMVFAYRPSAAAAYTSVTLTDDVNADYQPIMLNNLQGGTNAEVFMIFCSSANDEHWFVDDLSMATGPRLGSVSRDLPAVFKPGANTVTLTATPESGGGQLVVTETVPAGATPTAPTATAGVASLAGQVITWTVSPTTGPATLTYTFTSASATPLAFTGRYDAGNGWLGLPTGGDLNTYPVLGPLSIFDWHGDIGDAPAGTPTGNPSLAGSATFSAPTYTVNGAGADVWENRDRCHLVAKAVTGNFQLEGVVGWQNPAGGTNTWAKAGLMVRANINSPSPHSWVGVRDPDNVPGREVCFQWRDVYNGASGSNDANIRFRTAPALVRLVRFGNTVTGYVSSGTVPSTFWALVDTHTNPGLLDRQVAACLFVTSHQDDGGANAGDELVTGLFSNVTLTPIALDSAARDIQADNFVAGGLPVHVVISLGATGSATVTVRETVPAGWTVSNISNGGTVAAGVITWTGLTVSPTRSISYDIAAPAAAVTGNFTGTVTDATNVTVPVTGENSVRALGVKTVIYICNPGSAQYPTYDVNTLALIGPAGLQIGATRVPGLSYATLILNAADAAEARTFTQADGQLIFISQTITSADAHYHTADPLPIVNTESAIMDNDLTNGNDGSLRSEMYFSEGSGTTGAGTTFDMNLINVTHDITKLFTAGNLRVSNAIAPNGAQIGRMTTPFAVGPGITFLAQNPLDATEWSLAVAEQGATGFLTPGAGASPAPARRANLGLCENTMSSPTVNGAYLMQRTIQWAIGDAVNAGAPAPSAPSNLTAVNFGPGRIRLDWRDNSAAESGFIIERRTSGTATWQLVARVRFDTTNYTDTNLQPVVYFYRVRAYNPAGESANSNEANATGSGGLSVRRWSIYQ